MGVYIPDMEKPKNCRTCNFKSNKEGECWFVHDENGCPLIEIEEPKVGYWIDHKKIIYTDPEIWGYSQECSLCGFTLGAKEYNYCPNCGAKMERGADDNME